MEEERKLGKIVLGIILALLLVSTVTSAFNIQPVKAEPKTIIVPDEYPTIQAAVDATSSGDTIIVRAGTYTENVKVSKDYLTIKSESGAEETVIQGEWWRAEPALEITANHVNIFGFTIKGVAKELIGVVYVSTAKYCNLSNNILQFFSYGSPIGSFTPVLHLRYSSRIILANNRIFSPSWRIGSGIYILNSNDNALINNVILNFDIGVLLENASNNVLDSNSLSSCGDAIRFECSYNNSLHENKISYNFIGIRIEFSCSNTIYFNDFFNNTFNIASTMSINN
jgi:parallel beta-helix repeat protein